MAAGAGKEIDVSFEFFPPRSERMAGAFWEAVGRLARFQPCFVSVTYGAGGTTRARTHAAVARLARETRLNPAAHLTCVGAVREEVNAVARAFHSEGVRHIVALRGDPPEGAGAEYRPHPDGYQSTAELVAAIRAIGEIEVSVAAYPEKHPESASLAADIDLLKAKVDAGACRAITQFFFDNDVYEAFVERVRAAGIGIPIVPGIAPVHNFQQIVRFAARAGARIPAWLAARFGGLDEGPEIRDATAIEVATEQVLDLIDRGVRNFHLYTMNRAELVEGILRQIGLHPLGDDGTRETAK